MTSVGGSPVQTPSRETRRRAGRLEHLAGAFPPPRRCAKKRRTLPSIQNSARSGFVFRARTVCAVLGATIAILAAAGGHALAQLVAAPESGAAATGERRRAIEEIVVTAQKTEQNVRDVPISVTAIVGDAVRDKAL